MTLAPPATFESTRRADVRLHLLPSAPHPLKDRARVHFHSYTMETVAEIVLSENARRPLHPGEDTFARLKLPEPALLLPGDRFIIRQFSPVVTVGGGVVLDAAPLPRGRGDAGFLKILAGGDGPAMLKARIARRQHEGATVSRLVTETGWTRNAIESDLTPALKTASVVRAGNRLLDSSAMEGLKTGIVAAAANFHKKNPLVGGIGKEELRAQVDASPEVFEAAAAMLLREKKIEIAGELARLPGLGVVMKDEEAESKKKIEDAFASAGLTVPALQDVLAGLKVDRVRAQKIVTLLLRDKILVKVSDELVFHRNALEELRRQMAAQKVKSPKIDVARFKEMTGVTRKYAIPLLEYLDRERVTRRVGDAREIL
jgi:selenocysteine-specific elongation factor